MKASRVVELVRKDIENSTRVNLMNYTCVHNLIKWGEKDPNREWWELVENTINIDADKFHADYAPNICKLVRLFWAYRDEIYEVGGSYSFFARLNNWDLDWKKELQNLDTI
jgi:hypothetical protein